MKSKWILGIALFLVLCIMISPMPMGEMDKSIDVQMGIEEKFEDLNPVKNIALSVVPWLAGGYEYRQGGTISGETGAGNNYPVLYHIYSQAGSSSGKDMYTAYCQEDYGDVRFTEDDGQTELDYWIEDFGAVYGIFWVEVSADLGSNQIIYIYYGTSGTTSTTSNIKTTFLLGDDFDDGSIDTDIWTIEDAGFTEVDGFLHFDYAGAARGMLYGKTAWLYNVEMVTSIKCLDTPYGGNIMVGLHEEDALPTYERAYNGWSAANTRFYRGTADESSATSAYVSTWVPQTLQRVSFYWISGHVYFSRNRAQDEDRTTNVPNDALYPNLREGTNDAYQNDMDWIFYRKRIATEPVPISWGSETQQVAPVNAETPVCTNLDDTDNLYAGYKTYLFTSNVTDANGYADIDYVYLESYDTGTTTRRWAIKYTESNNAFEETIDGSGYIELVTGSCQYSKSGTSIDITWHIKIEWTASPYNLVDEDLQQIVYDESSNSDTDSYDSNYNYISKVVIDSETLNDGSGNTTRGEYNSVDSITATGTVSYFNSGGDNYPASDEVDVWVSCNDVAGSPWNDTTLSNGAFSMTVDSDDVVGLDTYSFKVVKEGEGSGGTDFTDGADESTYVADAYTVSFTVDDNRININTNATVGYTVLSDYDSKPYDGTINLNYTTWEQASVQRQGFTVSSIDGDDTDGVTAISTNDDDYVIWDEIEVYYGEVSDARTNINEQEYPYFRLRLKYDNHSLYDIWDAVYINNSGATWSEGVSAWYKYYTQNSEGSWNFVVTEALENTYGITSFDSSSAVTYDQDIIWDSLTITITGPTDNRQNINANASGIVISAVYDYDGETFDGTFTLNNTDYNGDGTVVRWDYTVQSVTGDTHGITAIGTNDDTYMIWDRIKILTTSATINYIEYGSESTTVNVTAELDYDSHILGSGDTLYMNGTSMTWDTDHFYIVFGPYSVFDSWSLFVNSSSANEATYGITVVWLNGQDDTIATDRVKVISYAISDARDNINDYIWINVTVQYESDSSAITDGTIVINGYDFSYLGSGIWRHNRTQASATGVTFDTAVASGNTRGITVVNQNGQSQTAVWDSYTISFTVGDNRIDINVNATVGYTVISDHDAIAYDGTVSLNYTTWTQASAQRQGFTVSSIDGDDTYGITTISTNDDGYVIWDSLTITITGPTDNRQDLNTNASGIVVSAVYDYGGTFDGTFTLNNTDYNGDGTAVRWDYTVQSVTGDTYGITAISSNDDTYMIWDRVIFNGNVNMTWTIVVYYINFSYTGTYEYDSTAWTGYATVANTSLTTGGADHYEELTFASVVNKTFYATAIEDVGGHGLTGFTTDTVWCVWDDISVSAEHFFTQQSATEVWLKWDSALFTWSNTSAVADSPQIKIQSKMNGTNDDWGYIVSGYCGDLIIGDFNPSWYYANISIYAQFNGYDWIIWTDVIPVTILHSIQTNVWDLNREGDYYTLLMHTNYENASAMVWDDMETGTGNFNDSIYYGDYEGMHEWLRDTTVGTHNCTILINAGADKGAVERDYGANDLRLWYNFTYVVSVANLDVDIEAWGAEENTVKITGISNLDISWYVYNEGIYSTETGSETTDIGFTFDFAKNTGIGKHNFSIYFNDTVDGSQYRWFNRSYTISAVYGDCEIRLYGPDGLGLDSDKVLIYVNGTLLGGNEFYNRTDYVYNITITNFLNETVKMDNYTYARFLRIYIPIYKVKVSHMVDNTYIYFNLTSSGGATYSEPIGPTEIVVYYLYVGTTYTYTYRAALNGTSTATYTGSMTISTNTYILIISWGFEKILTDIATLDDNAGGGTSRIAAVVASQFNSMLLWTFGVVVIAFIVASPKSDAPGSIIKKIKKPKSKESISRPSKKKKFSGKKIQTLDDLRDKAWRDRK